MVMIQMNEITITIRNHVQTIKNELHFIGIVWIT